jgi:hypothetical protein
MYIFTYNKDKKYILKYIGKYHKVDNKNTESTCTRVGQECTTVPDGLQKA